MSRVSRLLVLIGSALAPSAIVIALSTLAFTQRTVPEALTTARPSPAAVDVLSDLTSVMLSMAIGIGIATAWLIRQPLKARRRRTRAGVFVFTVAMALGSIYAGLRFKYDMAKQLAVMPLDLDPLDGRIAIQSLALLGALSGLCLLGALLYLYRDQRFRLDKEGNG